VAVEMSESFCANAREAYAQEGFYVVKGLLPTALIQTCVDDFAGMMADQLHARGLPARGDFLARAQALHAADIDQFKRVLGALWRLKSVGDVFAHPQIRAFLKQVLGFGRIFVPGGQTVHVQSEELRIPGGYFGLDAHQDWPSVQGSLDGLGVWVPLCDIDDNAFPLEVVPGSHRRGLIAPQGNKTDVIWVVDAYADADYKAVCVEQGDVVFFSNFTAHRSGQKGRRNFVRLACSSRFDNGAEVSFVQRGYPTAYTRGVHRQLMDFASVDAVNQQLAVTQHPTLRQEAP
jgi:ectoine hydroxylase-related dioxygenase (phytanoyl-CoA dioxygenase family)